MNLPVLGRIQVQIHLADYGVREGWHIIAWDQDADGTAALNKKQGCVRPTTSVPGCCPRTRSATRCRRRR